MLVLVSSTNKTDRHDMHVPDILLKVENAQNTNGSQYILVNHKAIIRCSSVYIIQALSPQHPHDGFICYAYLLIVFRVWSMLTLLLINTIN